MEYDEDIYEKEMIDRMLDEDELADWEAGMMLGYDEDFEEWKWNLQLLTNQQKEKRKFF